MKRNRRIGLTILAVLGLLIGAMAWYTARIWQQAALDQELIQATRRGDVARLLDQYFCRSLFRSNVFFCLHRASLSS